LTRAGGEPYDPPLPAGWPPAGTSRALCHGHRSAV